MPYIYLWFYRIYMHYFSSILSLSSSGFSFTSVLPLFKKYNLNKGNVRRYYTAGSSIFNKLKYNSLNYKKGIPLISLYNKYNSFISLYPLSVCSYHLRGMDSSSRYFYSTSLPFGNGPNFRYKSVLNYKLDLVIFTKEVSFSQSETFLRKLGYVDISSQLNYLKGIFSTVVSNLNSEFNILECFNLRDILAVAFILHVILLISFILILYILLPPPINIVPPKPGDK